MIMNATQKKAEGYWNTCIYISLGGRNSYMFAKRCPLYEAYERRRLPSTSLYSLLHLRDAVN